MRQLYAHEPGKNTTNRKRNVKKNEAGKQKRGRFEISGLLSGSWSMSMLKSCGRRRQHASVFILIPLLGSRYRQ
jgi:hypothetical protein